MVEMAEQHVEPWGGLAKALWDTDGANEVLKKWTVKGKKSVGNTMYCVGGVPKNPRVQLVG